MTRKNHFGLVTANFKDKKNQFGLVTASFNDKKKPVQPSHSQFEQPGRTSLSKSQLVSMTRKNQFELVTGSLNNQEEPV